MLCNLFVAESLTEKRTRATDLQTVSPSHVSLTVNILLFSFFELGAWMTKSQARKYFIGHFAWLKCFLQWQYWGLLWRFSQGAERMVTTRSPDFLSPGNLNHGGVYVIIIYAPCNNPQRKHILLKIWYYVELAGLFEKRRETKKKKMREEKRKSYNICHSSWRPIMWQ